MSWLPNPLQKLRADYPCPQCGRQVWDEAGVGAGVVFQCRECGFNLEQNPADLAEPIPRRKKRPPEAPQPESPKIDLEAQAIALLFKQDWSIPQIAKHLKVARQTPYRWGRFRKAAERAGKLKPRGPKDRNFRRGHKTPDGRIEAYQEE